MPGIHGSRYEMFKSQLYKLKCEIQYLYPCFIEIIFIDTNNRKVVTYYSL